MSRQQSDFRDENLLSPTHRKGGCATRAQIHEPTVVQQPPVSEQPRKHRQWPGMPAFGSRTVLDLQSLNRAARWQFVRFVQLRIDDLREKLRNGWQPASCLLVLSVLRLAQHELTCVGVVADVQPVVALPVRSAIRDSTPSFARIHTPNDDVRLFPPSLI